MPNLKKLFFIYFVILLSSNVCAKNFSLSGYFDTGKQYSVEDYEDTLLDDEYKYKYIDYESKDNLKQNGARISFDWMF
jgi:hypothetical protein